MNSALSNVAMLVEHLADVALVIGFCYALVRIAFNRPRAGLHLAAVLLAAALLQTLLMGHLPGVLQELISFVFGPSNGSAPTVTGGAH